jgi:methionyl-tRNA formyltransferase
VASILLISKDREDFYIQKAIDFTTLNFPQSQILLASPDQTFPEKLLEWEGDYLISYLCPWVLPGALLKKAKIAAINFHPATPDYPGTGCTNFALYNNEREYGVMCHYMAPQVDTGNVIAVQRFPILPDETVYTLTQRCYAYMLVLFYDILSAILMNHPLPSTDEKWSRKPYCRKDLNALKKIDLDMSPDEIKRRVHASTYPGTPGAYIMINGIRFEYTPDPEKSRH